MRWNFKGMCVENGIGYELRFSQTDNMKCLMELWFLLGSGASDLLDEIREKRKMC